MLEAFSDDMPSVEGPKVTVPKYPRWRRIRVTTPNLPDFIDPRPQGRISCSNDPWQGNFIPMGKSENTRSIEIRTHGLSTVSPEANHFDVIHLPL